MVTPLQPGEKATATNEQSITDLERLCLALTAKGGSIAEISQQLSMPEAFIEDVLLRAETKLGAKNRFHAICLSISMGLVRTDSI